MANKAWFRIISSILTLVILVIEVGLILHQKSDNPDLIKYPVMGITADENENTLTTPLLKDGKVKYAYIRSTEGKYHVDSSFKKNVNAVKEAKIPYGYYHFFSFASDGQVQAYNAINAIGDDQSDLPIAIYLEYYGKYEHDQPDPLIVKQNIKTFSEIVSDKLGKKVIIKGKKEILSKYAPDGFKWWVIQEDEPKGDTDKVLFWEFSKYGDLTNSQYYGKGNFPKSVYNGSEYEFNRILNQETRHE